MKGEIVSLKCVIAQNNGVLKRDFAQLTVHKNLSPSW